jgi:ArsR family transcriptional regulator
MTKQLSEMEALFKALADTTRLRILGLLLSGEVCVCDIHESLKIPQSKASRHLAYLRKTGLVATRRDGLWVYYRLGRSTDPVLTAISGAVQHALTHIDAVHKDGERLQKRTGCCVPKPGDVARASCCGAAAAGPLLRGKVETLIERAEAVAQVRHAGGRSPTRRRAPSSTATRAAAV